MAGAGKRGPTSRMGEWEKDDKTILIRGWKKQELTDEQVAHNIGITSRTLYKWANKSVHIKQALKYGKEQANYIIENELFKKAYHGNTTAMIFYLKNNYRENTAIVN